MRIELTDQPLESDESFVIAQTRGYNATFTERDVRPLCVFNRNDSGEIVAGLTGRTYWNYLEVEFLWVSEAHRGLGIATQLMEKAESEAIARGCQFSQLDTFSFQALGFYERLGYREFGRLNGFCGRHTRHFLSKAIGTGVSQLNKQ
jgi:ribosomal protein S18 acetylase RimI-like enzyme